MCGCREVNCVFMKSTVQTYTYRPTYLYIHLYVKFCEVVDCELEAVVRPCLCMCAWGVEEGGYLCLCVL